MKRIVIASLIGIMLFSVPVQAAPEMIPIQKTAPQVSAENDAAEFLSQNAVKIPLNIYTECVSAGNEYQICPEMLMAICWVESNCQPDVKAGSCCGLMQVNPRWHTDRMDRLGVTDIYDPEGNIKVAADYLAELFRDNEDPAVVLMEYNGDSHAKEPGYLSIYAEKTLKISAALERVHGK